MVALPTQMGVLPLVVPQLVAAVWELQPMALRELLAPMALVVEEEVVSPIVYHLALGAQDWL